MKNKFQPILLLTVNNSICNKKNRFTIDSLCKLFSKNENFFNVEKYTLETIKTEDIIVKNNSVQ